jgi:hypothetical protein
MLLIHCKNADSLLLMSPRFMDARNSHYFCHRDDPAAITSRGRIWLHDVGIKPDAHCIVPLITLDQVQGYPWAGMAGVCSDFVAECREKFQ